MSHRKENIIITAFGILLVLLVAGDIRKSGYTAECYLIPTDSSGVFITGFCPVPDHIEIKEDTAGLFRVLPERDGIALKAGKSLSTADSTFRFGLSLELDGVPLVLELLADGFSRNGVIAHRGAWKKKGFMENSRRAFLQAVELGCEASELDVRLSGDRKIYVAHNATTYGLDIENNTAARIEQNNAGKEDPVLSLQEMLETARTQNTTQVIIDIKESEKSPEKTLELADSTVALVQRMKMQGYVSYTSFNPETIWRIREQDRTARIIRASWYRLPQEHLISGYIFCIAYPLFSFKNSKGLIREMHKKGIRTNVWTINRVHELIFCHKKGIDCITTDEPELLLKIIDRTRK